MKERIKKILEEKKLTQSTFADLIGVGRPNVTHLMKGRNNFSQIIASNTLLAFPDINPMWLLKGEGNMYKNGKKNYTEIESANELKNKKMDTEIMFPDSVENYREEPESQLCKEEMIPQGEMSICEDSKSDAGISHAEEARSSTNQSQLSGNENQSLSKKKKIEKIVFFYTDQTFEEYYPKG
ncbi:MAG: helix-turn-helix transcriptional regulator [Bacteroidales bacterium]|nr:helix-turn-helix transcriptional regulator [Bacteroidales bacterium]MDD4209595.1 helix-turn-helix transcriptional regulator [Bacteroidales bacterium]